MLWTIFVILLVLWLLGVVSSYTLGGFIHILLVVAIVMILIYTHLGVTPISFVIVVNVVLFIGITCAMASWGLYQRAMAMERWKKN